MGIAKKYCDLYFTLMWASLKTQLTYTSSFLIGLSASAVILVGDLLLIWTLFSHISTLNGWTFWQLMFIAGLSMIPYGAAAVVFADLYLLSDLILDGDLDGLLARPMSLFFQLCTRRIDFTAGGSVIAGLILVYLASKNLSITWRVGDVILLLGCLGGGICIHGMVAMFLEGLAFFLPNRSGPSYLARELGVMAQYPIDLYSRPLQLLITWGIPFAFAGFVPAAFFMNIAAYRAYLLAFPVVIGVFSFLVNRLWKLGIRTYQSTGF